MKNVPLTNLVEQAVLGRMQAKASFTALDISNALKRERYPVQHREVAETVREIYASGAMGYYDYARETIPVMTASGTQQAQAFLYHWEEVRPRTYLTRDQTALPAVAPDQARDLTGSDPASPACLPRPVRAGRSPRGRTRRDGALAVPKLLLAQLGWPDGTHLTLRHDIGQMVIGSAPSGPAPLTVWGGQRLRICRTILRTASLSADAVTIEVEGNELKVKEK